MRALSQTQLRPKEEQTTAASFRQQTVLQGSKQRQTGHNPNMQSKKQARSLDSAKPHIELLLPKSAFGPARPNTPIAHQRMLPATMPLVT